MRHMHGGDVHAWLGSEQFQISGFLSLQGHTHSAVNEGMHEGLQKKDELMGVSRAVKNDC